MLDKNRVIPLLAILILLVISQIMLNDDARQQNDYTDKAVTEEITTEDTDVINSADITNNAGAANNADTINSADITNDADVTNNAVAAEAEELTLDDSELISSDIIHGNVVDLDFIPPFNGEAYVEVDGNVPSFTEVELTTTSFELYSELDDFGRPGAAYACVGIDIMPTEERGEIGQIKPAGWHTVKYDCVDGKYLYNRCHIIGYQLTGENSNVNNLMTGTRYMNVQGMFIFEELVADYVHKTNNHVLYRVTPIYEGDNLLATGVQIEAYSVEDAGKGICFNVFCYNAQPGVVIDLKTGDSYAVENDENHESHEDYGIDTTDVATEEVLSVELTEQLDGVTYIANKNTYKFHHTWCSSVEAMKEKNKWYYSGTREELIGMGYESCGYCNP